MVMGDLVLFAEAAMEQWPQEVCRFGETSHKNKNEKKANFTQPT